MFIRLRFKVTEQRCLEIGQGTGTFNFLNVAIFNTGNKLVN